MCTNLRLMLWSKQLSSVKLKPIEKGQWEGKKKKTRGTEEGWKKGERWAMKHRWYERVREHYLGGWGWAGAHKGHGGAQWRKRMRENKEYWRVCVKAHHLYSSLKTNTKSMFIYSTTPLFSVYTKGNWKRSSYLLHSILRYRCKPQE